MVGSATAALRRFGSRAATSLLVFGLAGCAVVVVLQARLDHRGSLSFILAGSALVAGASVVTATGRGSVSPAFLVILLAGAFLGSASAFACVLLSEFAASYKLKTPRYAVAFNVLGLGVPALMVANLIRIVEPHPSNTASFYLLVAGAGALFLTVNFAIVAAYQQHYRGTRELSWHVFWEYAPTQALNIAIAVAGAAIYVKVGLAGIVFALVAVFAFSYMAHLLERSRHRAQQYVSLSWGVLAGLMRSLDIRDQRAARHAAAVARFAKDMAHSLGMSEQDQELAHTAGLLHDIGHFALSDRVAERGRTLTEEDWVAIQRHPELGAHMLKDLGMYGPVEEIVLAHHERIDGRGYPNGTKGEEIPEIAKIISVAEVYDTLTASDTYRTRMSSFEALRELRRVADSQLDANYVEVLAALLSGEGVEYRHADAADFDTELDMERRIKEAGTG
jgi:putative nucleotidyltransferase with HDIG domain